MSKKFLVPIGFHTSPSDPSTGAKGEIYFNSTNNELRIFYDGTWNAISAGGGELHNVSINSLQDNDILQYNSSSQLWENVQFSQDPIVPSGADYPSGFLVNGKLFYNTSNGRTGIYFNNVWKEFAYVGDISILDNGNSSTSIFSEIIDGGNSETTLFIGQYDGGLSV